MENKDLKYLKKHYGENFAHLCRSLFPTILEKEGLLSKIISENFGQSKSLYKGVLNYLDEFKSYIFSFVDVEHEGGLKEIVKKTPSELLDEAGYILFPECKTESDIQSFKKYWAKGEELCTFRGGRLETNRVWFAIKKNVDEIKREDFSKPKREDEYGTSVISIQFSKSNTSTLSIKNRYNHSVNNPDATFQNNLDNIINGLMQSFVETYNIPVNLKKASFCMPKYRLGDDGKFYRENFEQGNICYCENNIILVNGHVVAFDKARYIVVDKYIIDKQKNVIRLYDESDFKEDAFIRSLGKIKSISTKKDKDGNSVIVFTPINGEDVELTINEFNEIIGYYNPNVTEIDNNFLRSSRCLTNLSLPNVTSIGDNFLVGDPELKSLLLPSLIDVGNSFLCDNNTLTNLSLPSLEHVGDEFLYWNNELTALSLPRLRRVGDKFLYSNQSLTRLSLPNLEHVGKDFLLKNTVLESLSLPNLMDVGMWFLYSNDTLTNISLPSLKRAEDYFLIQNKVLKSLYVPKLESIGYAFLDKVECLTSLYAPKLKNCPKRFKAVLDKRQSDGKQM